jgi:hypothetical protein
MIQWTFELDLNWRVKWGVGRVSYYKQFSYNVLCEAFHMPVLVCSADRKCERVALGIWRINSINAAASKRVRSQYAERMFHRIYAKLLTVYWAKCVFDQASLRCAPAICSRKANELRSTWESGAHTHRSRLTYDIYWACCSFYYQRLLGMLIHIRHHQDTLEVQSFN